MKEKAVQKSRSDHAADAVVNECILRKDYYAERAEFCKKTRRTDRMMEAIKELDSLNMKKEDAREEWWNRSEDQTRLQPELFLSLLDNI